MPLKDLEPFTNQQKKAIAAASSAFTPYRGQSWVTFRDRLWGAGEESFQRMKPTESVRVDPVMDVRLPSHHLVAEVSPIVRSSFTMESGELLVRSEYVEAEQAAVLSCNTTTRVFIIGGTPGIGLFSSFLDAQPDLMF